MSPEMNRINLIEENPQRGKENKNKQKHNFIKKEAKTLLNIKFEKDSLQFNEDTSVDDCNDSDGKEGNYKSKC